MSAIADVQSSKDLRNLPINRVGIKDLRFPIRVRHRDGEQATVARMTMTVFLNAEQKGTHMSRFVELMEAQSEAFDAGSMRVLLEKMLARLGADAGSISAAFPFFRTKAAPVSGIRSLLDYDIVLSGDLDGGRYRSRLKILIPVTSLCPCSKEISEYGAHNQRSHVTVTLDCAENVPPEDIIDIIENQASCQLYGLLKRPDEKYVTEIRRRHRARCRRRAGCRYAHQRVYGRERKLRIHPQPFGLRLHRLRRLSGSLKVFPRSKTGRQPGLPSCFVRRLRITYAAKSPSPTTNDRCSSR